VISRAVRDNDNNVLGIVYLVLRKDYLANFLAEHEEDGLFCLTDENGAVVCGSAARQNAQSVPFVALVAHAVGAVRAGTAARRVSRPVRLGDPDRRGVRGAVFPPICPARCARRWARWCAKWTRKKPGRIEGTVWPRCSDACACAGRWRRYSA
jgi:hypothetical protein